MNNGQAQIDWVAGLPHSRQYGDIYFSSDSGLEETRHVFLAHNHLQQRWQALAAPHFTIAETGFGTGLNFLCAWQLWNECAPPAAQLHFVSVEKFPLALDDLTQALSLWPQLGEQRDQLLAQYKWLAPGFHRLVFDQGRINLTLLIGDVAKLLPQLIGSHARARVDAWFLDGFSPAKNPEMWQQSLFDNMAELSHAETTFATFTSAGGVRRSLETAGFTVSKAAGFGRKREMLCGRYNSLLPYTSLSQDRRAIVIGGGIAGTASSHALACRGLQVQLIERHSGLAQEASGNPVGVLYPRLTINDTAQGRLALSSFLYTSRLLERLDPASTMHHACGLLQLAFDARETVRFEALAVQHFESYGLASGMVQYVDKAEASRLSGIDLVQAALHFPDAGLVKPAMFCAGLAGHVNIDLMVSSNALKLISSGAVWQVWDEQRMLAEAPVVIIANAADANSFEQSAHVQLQVVRGQISCMQSTAISRKLKTILCTDGYISPEIDGQQSLGATFSPDENSTEIRIEEHDSNLAMLRGISPELYRSLNKQPLSGRAALRCATSDYLPAAGQLLDSAALAARPPRHNADPAALPWQQGLYINTGHGSKGLITAPLCADMLAGLICGEPLPVDAGLLAALDPNRFLLRKMGLKRLLDTGRT
jgi:tRNA 5-methylaminomethyl-2-thiouridine biosynthesis bifunctional protein